MRVTHSVFIQFEPSFKSTINFQIVWKMIIITRRLYRVRCDKQFKYLRVNIKQDALIFRFVFSYNNKELKRRKHCRLVRFEYLIIVGEINPP